MVRCCLDSNGGGLSSTRKLFGGKSGTGLSGTAPGQHWSPLRPRQTRKGRIQMRRRITKAFFATAAAGAAITTLGFAAASPAGAAAGGMHFTPSAPETATDAHGALCGAPGDITGTWSSTDCGKAGYV